MTGEGDVLGGLGSGQSTYFIEHRWEVKSWKQRPWPDLPRGSVAKKGQERGKNAVAGNGVGLREDFKNLIF